MSNDNTNEAEKKGENKSKDKKYTKDDLLTEITKIVESNRLISLFYLTEKGDGLRSFIDSRITNKQNVQQHYLRTVYNQTIAALNKSASIELGEKVVNVNDRRRIIIPGKDM